MRHASVSQPSHEDTLSDNVVPYLQWGDRSNGCHFTVHRDSRLSELKWVLLGVSQQLSESSEWASASAVAMSALTALNRALDGRS